LVGLKLGRWLFYLGGPAFYFLSLMSPKTN
jgi:hypothetical protein